MIMVLGLTMFTLMLYAVFMPRHRPFTPLFFAPTDYEFAMDEQRHHYAFAQYQITYQRDFELFGLAAKPVKITP